MAKKFFTDESLATFVDEVKSYTDNAVSTKANSSHNHAASNITSGTLSSDRLPTVPITKGGTGATTAAAALTNLGITATATELNKLDGVTATTTELNYVDGVTSNIQTQLDGKATSSHTHNYAGSSSAGGAATSANKVNKSLTIQLNSGSTEGTNKFTFDGSAAKSMNITASSIGAAASSHTHDDRYYTETEVDTKLNDKVPTSRTVNGKALSSNISLTASDVGAAASSHTHNYLEKTTYEKSAELACGSNGLVCLGKFGAYDTNITIELNCTTSTTYHATIVIHSQNVVANGTGGTVGCYVYDDADNHVTPLLSVFRPYGSANRQIEVYANLPGWSKNLVHIQGVALSDGGMTNVLTSVSSIPTSISGKQKVTPVNVLTTNFASSSHTHTASSIGAAAASHTHDDRYYTETEIDSKISTLNTAINGKQATITGGATTITSSNLTASRALISDGSGKVAVSAVTSTELGYLDGVTSNIQTQLNGKASITVTENSDGTVSLNIT